MSKHNSSTIMYTERTVRSWASLLLEPGIWKSHGNDSNQTLVNHSYLPCPFILRKTIIKTFVPVFPSEVLKTAVMALITVPKDLRV